MKKIYKTAVIAPLLIVFFILLNPHIAKTNMAAPPAGGLSGDPARITCAIIGCHFGTALQFGPGELTLNMGETTAGMAPMSGQSYSPSQTYYIELKPNIANGSTPRYGFQMTALTAGGTMAGAFTIVSAGRNSAEALLSRNYIGHKNANSNGDWVFQWTAPSSDSGAITFYYACNLANGDNATSGDNIYTGTVVLNYGPSTNISSPGSSFESLNLYPNPAKDFVMLSFANASDNLVNISLYGLDGKKIQSQDFNAQSAVVNNIRYQLPASLSPGIYLLELEGGNRRSVQRVAVL
jgi:hypothetical protein